MLRATRFTVRGATKLAAPQRFASTHKIIYTQTDEAPALATYNLLPIVNALTKKAGINVEKADISLAARILCQFPDELSEAQRVPDTLTELGKLCSTPECNIIKLPNVSASVPQLVDAITELRAKGFNVPLYVPTPSTPEEKINHEKHARALGSSVNPVLREGNSDRRVAVPVKNYAKKNPHTLGGWSRASRSHVAHMSKGDFYASEKSAVMTAPGSLRIEHVAEDGTVKVMKQGLPVQAGEVVDSAFISVSEFSAFMEREISSAKKDDILFSLHLKATMMKISDPILFGHAVKVFYKSVFEKHGDTLAALKVNPNNGWGDIEDKVKAMTDSAKKAEILATIEENYAAQPWVAMVDSGKGITNLHVPSDVIIDASMPCVVRDSGKMWNKDNQLEDVKCIIPDRCYATAYSEIMSFVKANNQFDVSTMGNVANVGLMAQKAEEYGSHPTTFEVAKNGTMRVVNEETGAEVFTHKVEGGDIWRMCQTKDAPIKDWVRLAVSRAKATGSPAIFWLDNNRAHDRNIIEKVNQYLPDHNTAGLDISIMSPQRAMRRTCERCRDGLDTISVTGNVLRDYLTDLFPILELGTSAKMLSIVPLLAGGGLFETGAGGSAPKHVQQYLKEGHLRWDSLGEYLAIAVSLEHMAETTGNKRAEKLAKALNQAIERLLENRKSPGRKVNQLDNRASNFYIGLYWSEFMATIDPEYKPLADKLCAARGQIVSELTGCQGKPVDAGGYYMFDDAKVGPAMNPSTTLNQIIAEATN